MVKNVGNSGDARLMFDELRRLCSLWVCTSYFVLFLRLPKHPPCRVVFCVSFCHSEMTYCTAPNSAYLWVGLCPELLCPLAILAEQRRIRTHRF
ncbi:hypothetical protein VIGAN_02020600 [Vigna angularis var. angularis]|uniref:Uncharacterized protein n=1 Tax=Vigna angularis var. angularis TaxID=157739 RepID=A0A0S3RAJ5_PHAAN|nr:hypothetical protein VIGAN_02020600 [Vigna angularis var. angularis]